MGRKSKLKAEAREEVKRSDRLSDNIELYTVRETAELLRVHPVTIRNWVNEGKVKALNIETNPHRKLKKLRIERKELDRILKAVEEA